MNRKIAEETVLLISIFKWFFLALFPAKSLEAIASLIAEGHAKGNPIEVYITPTHPSVSGRNPHPRTV